MLSVLAVHKLFLELYYVLSIDILLSDSISYFSSWIMASDSPGKLLGKLYYGHLKFTLGAIEPVSDVSNEIYEVKLPSFSFGTFVLFSVVLFMTGYGATFGALFSIL